MAGPETAEGAIKLSQRFLEELRPRLAGLQTVSGCRALTIIVELVAPTGRESVRASYRRKDERQVVTAHVSAYRWLDASARGRVSLYAEALADAIRAADPKRVSLMEQQQIIDAIADARDAARLRA